MITFAMLAVWAGVSFSNPGKLTGCSLPESSTCGGRPGEKIKSLTLSEVLSICRNKAMKFNGGGVPAGEGGVIGLLIFDLEIPRLATRGEGRVCLQ
jgi:hypothetical protein